MSPTISMRKSGLRTRAMGDGQCVEELGDLLGGESFDLGE
jgi:hypothetical protein